MWQPSAKKRKEGKGYVAVLPTISKIEGPKRRTKLTTDP